MKPAKKRGHPIVGLIAGLMLLAVVTLGLVTGRMPLAGANNLGVELDRWPIAFWTYTAVLAGLGIAAVVWSVRTLAKDRFGD